MSEQWQIRRGTTAENNDFTGAEGEITMDTDKKQLRVHDGQTQGGAGVIDPIVAFQVPTAGNNYTWYRKYRSGWVEQGGQFDNSARLTTINLPVAMANTNYYVSVMLLQCASDWSATVNAGVQFNTRTTTSFVAQVWFNTSNTTGPNCWEVKGMAA